MYGKKVKQLSKINFVDLSRFDSGIYIVHVTVEGKETIVKKVSIIKE